jgi:tetratricopeptide (TPR) repeat protein
MPVGPLELKGIPEPVAGMQVVWAPATDAAPVPLPTRLAVAPAAFVGRSAELEVVFAALKAAASGQRKVVLIAGEPGIGKTTLVTRVANEAYEQACTVLYGRCDEELGVPYQPFLEALGHLVEHLPEPLLAAHIERFGAELARIVPELARRAPDAVEPTVSDPETERYLLFGAVLGLLRRVGEVSPVVLVLDDLHWADKPTITLLRHLAAAPEGGRLLILATYRDSDIGADHPMSDALVALRRETDVERIAVKGLDELDVLALLEVMAGHEMDADGVSLAHELRRETDGNPFFAVELLRHLAETRAIQLDEDGRWHAPDGIASISLPESVREVVGQRVNRLGLDARKVLSSAAVIGRDFDLDLLARVTEIDEDRLLDLLDEAQAASVVIEVEGRADRFSFTHALIQHTLYEDMGRARAQRAHRRIATELEALCGADPGARIGEIARHWFAAVQPVESDKALDYARRAGDRALAQLAPDEAIRWYSKGLDLLVAQPDPDPALETDLRIGLGEGQRQVGDPAYRETLIRAAESADSMNDGPRLVRAALANNRGWVSGIGVVDHVRLALLERALDHVDAGSADRCRLLALMATELTYGGEYQRQRELSDEAVALARQLDDPATLLTVFVFRIEALRAPSTLDERRAEIEEALAIADELDDAVATFWLTNWKQFQLLESGRYDAVPTLVEDARRLADRLGQPLLRWQSTFIRSLHASLSGDVDAAEELATEAFQIANDTGQPDGLVVFGANLFSIRWPQGRLAELPELWQQTIIEHPGVPIYRASLAFMYSELGRLDEARELLDPMAANDFADVAYDSLWLPTLHVWAGAAAGVGDRHAATVLYDLMSPWSAVISSTGANVLGPVSEMLGRLAIVLDRRDDAVAHLQSACAALEHMRAPFLLARCELTLGELTDDRALIESALARSREFGCPDVERQAMQRLA